MSDIYQFNVGGTTYNLANLGLLAPVQITLTADRLYNTGDQFIYTGLLYEATETIAQGTSITIGSNAQLADCVTKQISEINSNLTSLLYSTTTGANETYGTLLARIFSNIAPISYDYRYSLKIGGSTCYEHYSGTNALYLSTSTVDTDHNNGARVMLLAMDNGTNFAVTGVGNTTTNITNNNLSPGVSVKLYRTKLMN